MVSVQARRDAVAFATTRGVSQRRACTLLDVARSCSARVFWTTSRRRRLWPGISIRTSLRALAISIATRTALSGIE